MQVFFHRSVFLCGIFGFVIRIDDQESLATVMNVGKHPMVCFHKYGEEDGMCCQQ